MLPNTLNLPTIQVLNGAFEKWSPDESQFQGRLLMPEEGYPMPYISWEDLAGIEGITPAHALDSPPPVGTARARTVNFELPFYFGEQQQFNESDFLHIRARGTFDQLAGARLVVEEQQKMLVKLVTRIEQTRWAAMQGSLAINENGVKRTVTYSTKSISSPSTLWSVVASANPIADLQAWNILFRGQGDGPLRCYFNAKVASYLAQNSTVRDLIKANAMGALVGSNNIGEALTKVVGDVEFIQYDGGYKSGGTYYPFIPDNKIVLVKNPSMGQTLGGWKSTITAHNGGPFNPQPGRFMWVEDEMHKPSCMKYKFGCGIYGIPVLYFPENVAAVTVAS